MSYKRTLLRGLTKDRDPATPSPRKEGAKRYEGSVRLDKGGLVKHMRGGKIRGSKTKCPHCGCHFMSKKARAHHIQLSHRRRLIGEKAEVVQAAD
jgi:uncharacterized C2H2 Zn-finger protein